MNSISKNQNGFGVIEALLIILVLGVLGGGGYYVWHTQHKTKPTTTSSSKTGTNNNPNAQTQDSKVEQDLASIGEAIQSLPYNNSNDPAFLLPPKLTKLHVKLNYNIGSYPYKILEDDGGEDNSYAIYEICANFNSNTFSVAAYDNGAGGASNNPGTAPTSYAVHSQGEQCFTNSITQEVNGVDMVLNSNESQYQNQLTISNNDWPVGFPTPVDLPLAQ